MEQLDFFDVPSPCIGVCSCDERGYCKGCMRNREERFNWLTLTNEEKIHVIRLCQRRYKRKIQQQRNKKTPESADFQEFSDSDDIQSSLF
jgi:hypothetical protein